MPCNDPEQRRQYQRNYYRRHKRKLVARNAQSKLERRRRNYQIVYEYLRKHPCVDCGESDPIVLDFDHVRGVKFRAISDMCLLTYSIERLQAEMDKCEVRCANCHRRRTAKQQRWEIGKLGPVD